MQTVKIVVCDDDRAMQEILRQQIEKLCEEAKIPCSIACCDSGEEVLREKSAPDILFLDIQMPERNGMEIAKELCKRHYKTILIKKGGISMKVLLADIIYAEVFNRKVMLHTTQGDIEYYGKLTELSEMAGTDFYRSHRAYLVNLKYVEKYTATTIWLEQGTALVSKKQFPGFVLRYMQYISGKRSG